MEAIQNRHRQGSHPDEQDVRKHEPVQINSFDLNLILPEHGKQANRQRGKNHAQYSQGGQHRGECPEQAIRKRPGFFPGTIPHVIGEDRNERSRHRSLANETAKDIRDPVCQNEGIGDARGSQKQSQPLITDISENSTDNRNDSDNRSRLEDLLLVGDDVSQKIEAPSLSLILNL